MKEILIGLGGTIVGGVIVWVIQQYYLNRREKERLESLQVIKSSHSDKIITTEIFFDLAPGKSIELMKQMLGAPRTCGRLDAPVFSNDSVETHSYLYFFQNGMLKITSVDNEVIDTLTVFGDSRLSVEKLFYPVESPTYSLGEVKVCAELVAAGEVSIIASMRDSSFAIRYTVPAPIYLSYTYFGGSDKVWDFRKSNDATVFIGETIEGVCISRQSQEAYFISDSELR